MESKDNTPPQKETLAQREERILDFWNTEKIFEKTLAATEKGEPFVFFDGPPFATGMPHYGHLLAGTIKDVIPRYQTMRGRYVRRVWGWDCHGLPVENLIEKELGIEHKKDIEEFGIDNFNAKAEASVLMYDKEWKEIVPRMGRWVDMEHAYKTMDAGYTSSVWWIFKTLYDRKYIYEGYKAMHVCPRCETTLAASEVALGYKDIKDISVTVKFPLRDNPDVAFLAWTTTPWTLPGNVALAVSKSMTYARFTLPGDTMTYIALKDALPRIAPDAIVSGEVLGEELVGTAYIPPFLEYAHDAELENREKGWHVYAADFVTSDTGTGIVHIAPAFGEDDMRLGKEMGLPFVQHVRMNGTIKEEVAGFAGMHVKPLSDNDRDRLNTDIAVIAHLQQEGRFYSKENLVHSYPHCWRCEWPLLNYAASSWFVNVTDLKEKAVEANKEVNWVPDAVGHGRFHNWLEGARDWAISRSRYWGAPLPVWKCNSCSHIEVVGNVTDLKQHIGKRNTYFAVRHGQAISNEKDIVSCKPDPENVLTEKGQKEAEKAAERASRLKIDLIVSSPLTRTKETAERIAEACGIAKGAIVYDARLREVDLGDLHGHPNDEYRALFPNTKEKFNKNAPGGESLKDMKRRFGECLYEVDTQYVGKNVLFVTHEYGVWMLDAVARGANEEETITLRDHAGIDYVQTGEVAQIDFTPLPHNLDYALDLHRPYIDDIHFACTCGGVMKRIQDVFDCWFESGAMPFAQHSFEGNEANETGVTFLKNFPANFIAEGLDQTRGWFYTLLVLSIGLFGKSPYKNVIVNGLVLAEDGQKMSKKLRNYPDPMDVANKYGADALRFYLVSSPAVRGEDLRFSPQGVDEIAKKLTVRLDNVRSFYEMYKTGLVIHRTQPKAEHILDRWIVARWNETHVEVTHYLETHELDRATKLILPLIDDLSTWWLRRSRDRLKGEGQDRDAAEETFGWILFQIARLLAPFAPFLAEDLYQRIPLVDKKESVHLDTWPIPGVAMHDALESMEAARKIVTLALEQRAKHGIKVRQPLAQLSIGDESIARNIMLTEILLDELNVKDVAFDAQLSKDAVLLDLEITPELKEEGLRRDILRAVQDERKKLGLVPGEEVTLSVSGDAVLQQLSEAMKDMLKEEAAVVSITRGDGEAKLMIDGMPFGLLLQKK